MGCDSLIDKSVSTHNLFHFYPFNSLPLPLHREWVTGCVGISWQLELHHHHPSEWIWHPGLWTQNFYKPHIWLSVVKALVLFYIDCFSQKTSPCVSMHSTLFAEVCLLQRSQQMCHKDSSVFICKLSSQMIFGSFFCWKKAPERERKKTTRWVDTCLNKYE